MALSNSKVSPTIPVADIERAKKFYEEKLGLKKIRENEGGAYYEAGGGTSLMLFPTPRAGSNPMTYAGWEVADIDAEVKELRDKGVMFEEYDTPAYKTVNGIATMPTGEKVAWFKDSEGNTIGLGEVV